MQLMYLNSMIESLRKRSWFSISGGFEKSGLSWILGDEAGRGRKLGGFARSLRGFHGQGSPWVEGLPWPEGSGVRVSMDMALAHGLHGLHGHGVWIYKGWENCLFLGGFGV